MNMSFFKIANNELELRCGEPQASCLGFIYIWYLYVFICIHILYIYMCVCVRYVKKNIEGSFGPFWTIMSLSRVAGGQLGGRRGQIMLLHHVTLYLIIFYVIHVFGRNESECPTFGDSKSPRIRTLRTLGQFRWEKTLVPLDFSCTPAAPTQRRWLALTVWCAMQVR